MARRIILLATLFLMSWPSQARDDIDVRGLHVDWPLDCEALRALIPEPFLALEAKNYPIETCEGFGYRLTRYISYMDAGANITIELASGPGRVIKMIELSNFDYKKALVSLTAKYGKPKVVRETLTTVMGAKVQQVRNFWRAGSTKLELALEGSAVNEGAKLYLTGKRYAEESEAKSTPSPKI